MADIDPKDAVLLKKVLAHPLLYPETFKSWIPDWLAMVSELHVDQVYGYEQQRVRSADRILTAQAVTSASYTDLSTAGPILSGLSNGFYMLIFGARITARAGSEEGFMSPSLNGTTPSDDNAAAGFFNHIFRATLVELKSGDNNEVAMKYKQSGGTSVTFGSRFLHAMKVIDADAQ